MSLNDIADVHEMEKLRKEVRQLRTMLSAIKVWAVSHSSCVEATEKIEGLVREALEGGE